MIEAILNFIFSLEGAQAYTIVFFLTMFEALILVGLFLPGDTVVIVAGVLVFYGNAGFLLMGAAAGFGAVIGDSATYWMGRLLGGRYLTVHLRRMVGERKWERASRYMQDSGAKAVATGRVLPGVRVVMPWIAGMTGMRFTRFLPANLAGSLLWSYLMVTAGYLAGTAWREVQRYAGAAAAFTIALVVLIALVVWGGRYASRNPERMRAIWIRARAWRPVRWFEGATLWLGRRFKPNTLLGLRLTLGLGLIVATGLALYGLSHFVVSYIDVLYFDIPLLRAVTDAREPWLVAVMRAARWSAHPAVIAPIAAAAAIAWQIGRGSWRAAWLMGVSLAGATAFAQVLRAIVARPRPDMSALIEAAGYSYPSIQAVRAAAVFGVLAYLAAQLLSGWKAEVWLAVAAIAASLIVGASDLVLGLHYPTDVLAGYLLGGIWLAVAVTTLPLAVALEDEPS